MFINFKDLPKKKVMYGCSRMDRVKEVNGLEINK